MKTPSEVTHPLKLVGHVSTIHPESADLICEDCGLFFRSKLTVEFHQKMTHKSQLTHKEKDEKMWSCPICTKKFRGTIGRGILFHLQTCESKLEKMTKGCPQCDRVFDVKIITESSYQGQRYTYRVLQTIQIKLMLLCVWAEPAVSSSTKTDLKFKYDI